MVDVMEVPLFWEVQGLEVQGSKVQRLKDKGKRLKDKGFRCQVSARTCVIGDFFKLNSLSL